MLQPVPTQPISITEVEYRPAAGFRQAKIWAIDAEQRSMRTFDVHRAVFTEQTFAQRLAAVMNTCRSFFIHCGEIYVNYRPGRSRPFAVVKVSNTFWPSVSRANGQACFYQPIAAAGGVIKFSRRTNSYLIHVYP